MGWRDKAIPAEVAPEGKGGWKSRAVTVAEAAPDTSSEANKPGETYAEQAASTLTGGLLPRMSAAISKDVIDTENAETRFKNKLSGLFGSKRKGAEIVSPDQGLIQEDISKDMAARETENPNAAFLGKGTGAGLGLLQLGIPAAGALGETAVGKAGLELAKHGGKEALKHILGGSGGYAAYRAIKSVTGK